MAAVLEFAVVGLLFALYLGSFSLASQVNQTEVFAQDSLHILQSLASDDTRYPWNPQNHILLRSSWRGRCLPYAARPTPRVSDSSCHIALRATPGRSAWPESKR